MHPYIVQEISAQYQREARERAARWRLGRLVRSATPRQDDVTPGVQMSRRRARAETSVEVGPETDATADSDAVQPSSVEATSFVCVR